MTTVSEITMSPGRAMTADEYGAARRALMRRDPVLRAVMRRHGPCPLGEPTPERADPFVFIIRAITAQQLSSKAAATIFARLRALVADGPFDAAAVARLSDERLRGVGLSAQKVAYIRDLCAKVGAGALDLAALGGMSDADVVAAVTQVKGLGRWSAEMVLIFHLRRPDILPLGDLGIVTAIRRLYGMRTLPKPARLLKLGEQWRPYRSVASWYLWRSLENDPQSTRDESVQRAQKASPARRARES
jgi:DNA-3-methyladenine glycosylase II